MATVRISGNWRNPNKKDWAGAPEIDDEGHIERSIDIPEEAYRAIERDIARGRASEGVTILPNGTRFEWFVDR